MPSLTLRNRKKGRKSSTKNSPPLSVFIHFFLFSSNVSACFIYRRPHVACSFISSPVCASHVGEDVRCDGFGAFYEFLTKSGQKIKLIVYKRFPECICFNYIFDKMSENREKYFLKPRGRLQMFVLFVQKSETQRDSEKSSKYSYWTNYY